MCWDGARLLSGEPLSNAVAAALPESPAAVLANCLPPSNVGACLPVLRDSALPFGIYPNLGAPEDDSEAGRTADRTPTELADDTGAWLDAGARIVGGCCGTTPAHIRAIAELLARR